MMKFLRHRSSHMIYIAGDGSAPKLNPTSYTFSRDTTRINEPGWLYRLRMRFFSDAGEHACPERGSRLLPGEKGPNPDRWRLGPDGYRTCTYCGSIHFDDLLDIAKKSLTDPAFGVEGTTKGYKRYVKQPGVINAGYGAIKYYTWHTPATMTEDQEKLVQESQRLTHQRFLDRLQRVAA